MSKMMVLDKWQPAQFKRFANEVNKSNMDGGGSLDCSSVAEDRNSSSTHLRVNIFEQIRQRKGIRASLSNITWLGGDRFIRMFGAVVVGTLVARYLGPTNFGF